MHYFLRVQVVDALKDLLEQFLGVLLRVSAGAGDFVKDFRSVDELYNLVNNVLEIVDKDLFCVYDVRMLKLRQDLKLLLVGLQFFTIIITDDLNSILLGLVLIRVHIFGQLGCCVVI